MFEQVQAAPPDAILGLTEAFQQDPNPDKINLGVGVYKDELGKTPILACVKEAERRLCDSETSKSYLPIEGSSEYGNVVQCLLFDYDHPLVTHRRLATAQTPGGTGGLRIAAEYLKQMHPRASIWLSEPTWPNHPQIFDAVGVRTKSYPYFDARTHGLALDAMLDALSQAPVGDAVLLHACCHNPTGVDPTPGKWTQIAEVIAERRLIPLIDCAYQGFAAGLREDAAGILALATRNGEMLIANSFSKNFGLYNERVGALTVVAERPNHAQAVMSHIKRRIRANYSNPPSHGAAIVRTILEDDELYPQWLEELRQMRDRINRMRRLFVQTLKDKGAPRDFDFIAGQTGMFSFSGLTKEQVDTLRENHSIYIVGSGRINVAGMTETNMDRLCEAIVNVL